MSHRASTLRVCLLAGALAAPLHAFAQSPPLKAPDASPAATVTQTVGLSELKVSYHRPAVTGRKIWGALVPYGEVWRAGANENTTVSFSTAVKVAGKPLRAGTYGLHMIPTASDWTVIFSNMAVAWGSFSYDPKEDALRVTVRPQTTEASEERLAYAFDDPSETHTQLVLRWEKVKVAIPIEVDTPAIVMASMRNELRGVARFFWQPWNQAAQYWVLHGGNMDEAQKMADRSFNMNATFGNTMTRAAILDRKGDRKTATELRGKALAGANENELNQYGYQLLAQKKLPEAIAIFQKNVAAHPASWNVHDSLGEAFLAQGDRKAAKDSYSKALSLVKDNAQKKRIEHTLAELQD
jgi:hypothetical protein